MAFTYFFRDVQTFEVIRDRALPFLKTRQRIRIWDAGCAAGMEPFTLAMMLRERVGAMYFRNISLLATDIDASDQFEEVIRDGIYPREQVERIPEAYLKRYFQRNREMSHYQLEAEIRRSVSFLKHDLLTLVPPAVGFDLIICKNVLLHFSPEQREQVVRMFRDALSPGGFLAFEQTQKLPEAFKGDFIQVEDYAQVFQRGAAVQESKTQLEEGIS